MDDLGRARIKMHYRIIVGEVEGGTLFGELVNPDDPKQVAVALYYKLTMWRARPTTPRGMTVAELAQQLRHIAEELGGGGPVAQAVDDLHDLAEEIDPGSGARLAAYLQESDDGDSGTT